MEERCQSTHHLMPIVTGQFTRFKWYLSKLFQGEKALDLLQLLANFFGAWRQIHGARQSLQEPMVVQNVFTTLDGDETIHWR